MKPCSKCKIGERQHNGWCSPCNKAWSKEYRKSERSKKYFAKWREERGTRYYYKYSLKYKYGISLDEMELMIEKQNNLCASCGDMLKPNVPRQVHVDHCHKTKTVRVILCWDCNLSLGIMKENPTRIRRLADYAERMQNAATPSSFSPPPTASGGGGEKERGPTDNQPTTGEHQ